MILIKRANRDESKIHIYEKLVYNKDSNPNGIFLDLRSMFLFALLLGFKEKKKEKLVKKLSFGAGVMDDKKYQDIFAQIALIETKDVKMLIGESSSENLDSEEKIQNIIEEYANAGVTELESLVLQKKGVTIKEAFEALLGFHEAECEDFGFNF
ncbi:MAG: hypothetical protein ACRC54_01530 [Fusobacteriaceae bacterium]